MTNYIAFRNYEYLAKTVCEMTDKLYAGNYVGDYKMDLNALYKTNTDFLNQLYLNGIISVKQIKGLQENAFNIFCHYGEVF